MNTADFDYELPPGLIAQDPAPRRDESRMMVLRRAEGAIEHRAFRDLPEFLRAGDLLVVNDTRVIPVRMRGRKADTPGQVEVFFLEQRDDGSWDALVKARKRPPPGTRLVLGSGAATAVFLEDLGMGRARVAVECAEPLAAVLEREGATPLPPYIRRGEKVSAEHHRADRERYQTVYARAPGAVAAPTAGLHFTDALFAQLAARGVRRAALTLHVGLGTFRPVTAEQVEEHRMESERYEIGEEAARLVLETRAAGGRVVAVGSTTVRALETAAAQPGGLAAGAGRSELFIRPPYAFRAVDAMLTNFHLPKSTLLMMVCAWAGREFVLRAYAEAVREQYRFFSYGDCMLIL